MKKLLIAMAVAGLMTGCSSVSEPKVVEKPQKVEVAEVAKVEKKLYNDAIYIAYVNGREYAFYSPELFKEFLHTGEVHYFKSYIGAGTHGMTLIYSLNKDDSKNTTEPAPAEKLLTGKMQPAEAFYAEIYKEESNRFYVFGNWADFNDYMKTGIDNYHYSEIGAGPKGATVVYVLNKQNNKTKPVETVAKFKAHHAK